jgi:uncharacterized protein YneF (UPF0154 family)
MAKTYDAKCYELASVFLADNPGINSEAARVTMAQQIQQTIEDEIEFMHAMAEKA